MTSSRQRQIEGLIRWNRDGSFAEVANDVQFVGRCYRDGEYHSPVSAESLRAAYQQDGPRGFAAVNGTFALAMVDRRRDEIVLAVDPMGIETLSFARLPDGSLWYGQSLEGLQRIHTPSIDPQSVYDYFYFHMIPAPRTAFEGVFKVEPGQVVCISAMDERRSTYSSVSFEDMQIPDSALIDTLRDGVARCMPVQGRPAAFLSGGLDSTTVVGLAAAQPGGVHAFTVGFDIPRYDEVAFARASAEHYNVPMTASYVTPDDVLAVIEVVARSYGEPFGNSSAIPTYYCARRAAEDGYTTILAGDGGDELFAGNKRYQEQLIFDLYFRLPAWLRRSLLEPATATRLGRSEWLPIRKIRRYIEQACLPMPDRTQTYNYLNMFPLTQVFSADLLASVDAEQPVSHLRDVYDRCTSTDIVDRMLHLDWKLTLADNDLRKVKQMCTAAGIRVEFPMLDPALVALSRQMHGARKMPRFELRGFYKSALRDFLPAATLKKRKHGFGLPFGPWLASSASLRQLVEDRIESFAQRNVIREEFVRELASSLLGVHQGYYGEMVWLIVSLESWLQARPAYADFRI